MTDPQRTLATHEEHLEEWIDRLEDRRARLASLREAFPDPEDGDLPAEVVDSLTGLLESLEGDMEAQIQDLESDVGMVRELRGTLRRATDPGVEDRLAERVDEMDSTFEERRTAVEDLAAATDELADRVQDVVTGRYRE